MHNRLSHYCQTNSILVPEQLGFRKGMSIENAALKLTDSARLIVPADKPNRG
jgi:hypothetical protein